MTDQVLPFRLAVLVSLTKLISSITIEDGYKHDLTDRVYRGKAIFGNTYKPPFVSILDQPVPAELPAESGESNSSNILNMPLIVQGFVVEDQRNPTDPAHMLMADVRKCLAAEKSRNTRGNNLLGMNGTVSGLEIGLGTVRPPEAGISDTGFFWMLVTVKGAENLLDPYEWATRKT